MKSIKTLVKMIMVQKGIKVGHIAEEISMDRQQLSNWLYLKDGKAFRKLVEVADALDCDVALVDRKTGEVYKQ